jgi:hypothetical protein
VVGAGLDDHVGLHLVDDLEGDQTSRGFCNVRMPRKLFLRQMSSAWPQSTEKRSVTSLALSSSDAELCHCQRLSAAKAVAAVTRIPIQLREFTGRSHRRLADRAASAGLD